MFGVNVGTLARIATALARGDANIIEDLVERKVEQLGQRLIEQILDATPIGDALGALRRADALIETGGVSEIDRMRRQWLNSVQPVSDYNRFSSKIGKFFRKAFADEATSSKRRWRWQRGGWAKSRQQWLDEGWRHDWRSQPRNVIGEWIPGRLPYPVTTKLPVSRRVRKLRRIRRRYRAIGKQVGQGVIMSSWAK